MFSAATQQAVTANSGTFAMYRQAALKTTLFLLCKLFLHSCLWLIKLYMVLVLAVFLLQRYMNLLYHNCYTQTCLATCIHTSIFGPGDDDLRSSPFTPAYDNTC